MKGVEAADPGRFSGIRCWRRVGRQPRGVGIGAVGVGEDGIREVDLSLERSPWLTLSSVARSLPTPMAREYVDTMRRRGVEVGVVGVRKAGLE